MTDRIERLRATLDEPLLVTSPVNVRYLTGFASTNAALLVEDDLVQLFTDFRYADAARDVAGARFVETKRSIVADLAGRLSGRVGFEADHLRYADYETLAAGDIELAPRRGLVERLRAEKDEAELDSIRTASAITSKAYERLAAERFIGSTERELAWRMEELFHELGAHGRAFPVIVAAGPNGARPHAEPGERIVEAGQTIVVDAGCSIDGYRSDCTRTFAAGVLPEELKEAYAACLQGQEAGLEAVEPGRSGVEVDGVARGVIDAAGYGKAFGHGLGHGVGLLVHEAPRLSPESTDDLAVGNVVTVEPGIYLEGVGGIRIEDLVVVRAGGAEVLTSFTKDLVTVN